MKLQRSDGTAARRAALQVLGDIRNGRQFDAALDRAVKRLGGDDRRLVHELAAGVLRRQTRLDALLAPLVPRGWKKVAPGLKDVLRIGAYQLTVLDRVPAHAAVSTSVTLARETSGSKASGFVNAILRKLAAAEPSLFDQARGDGDAASADPAVLAATHSHPEWLVRRWVERFGGEGARALLEWNNRKPLLVLQPARASATLLLRRWRQAGIAAHRAPFGAGLVTDRSRPDELPGFIEGDFLVQDPAQALVAWYAEAPAGEILVDLCAAPGGKTVSIGRCVRGVIAADIHRGRTARLAENLRRAGSGREHAIVADGRVPPFRDVAALLLDAPCLGTGTFARHPDARWRVTGEALRSLAELQRSLLDSAGAAVRRGGLLVYSTCSLEPEENEVQVEAFLTRHRDFRREPPDLFPAVLLSSRGDLTVLPQRHGMDGAYAARLRRKK